MMIVDWAQSKIFIIINHLNIIYLKLLFKKKYFSHKTVLELLQNYKFLI